MLIHRFWLLFPTSPSFNSPSLVPPTSSTLFILLTTVRTAQANEFQLHLAFSSSFITALSSIYTLLTTFLLLLIFPLLRLLFGAPCLPGQIIRALSPILRLQLRLIKSTPFNSSLDPPIPPNAGLLFAVLVASPLVSLVVEAMAWVAGAFWFYATILGEPNRGLGREKEGRGAVRWVRSVWERWLLLSMGSGS